MSDFSSMVAVFGITIANLYLYVLFEKWAASRADRVLTESRGWWPYWYRRIYFIVAFTTPYAIGVAGQSIFTVGYLLMADSAPSESVKLYLHMYAFFSLFGVINWAVAYGLWAVALRRVVRAKRTPAA